MDAVRRIDALFDISVAIGRMHGLTLQVFREKGVLRWSQEVPNQVFWTSVGGRVQVIERGEASLSPEAGAASRVTIAHAEGMPLAFANIYADLAATIRARHTGQGVPAGTGLFPVAEDGLQSMAAVHAVAASGAAVGAWVDARPPYLRDT